jgi:predicted Rdx family selenoprotein
MSKTKGTKPSRKELKARIADLEQRNRDLARTVGQQLAQDSHLQAVAREYRSPAR